MANVTLVTTVSGASANSYVTLAQADAYFDERLNADDWTDQGDNDQKKALVMAARRLDQVNWKGYKATSGQALAWPRSDLEDKDGYTVASDTIPQQIQDAQCELALAILASDDFLADTGLEGFESVKVGPISVDPRITRTGAELPANVVREAAEFMESPPGVMRIERG